MGAIAQIGRDFQPGVRHCKPARANIWQASVSRHVQACHMQPAILILAHGWPSQSAIPSIALASAPYLRTTRLRNGWIYTTRYRPRGRLDATIRFPTAPGDGRGGCYLRLT